MVSEHKPVLVKVFNLFTVGVDEPLWNACLFLNRVNPGLDLF